MSPYGTLTKDKDEQENKEPVVKKIRSTSKRIAAERKKDIPRKPSGIPTKPDRKVNKMKQMSYWVTPAEYKKIKEIAKYNGISVSTLVRNSVLGRGRILRKLD